MIFAQRVQRFYESVLHRVRSVLLPLLLVVSYFTAWRLLHPQALSIFSHLQLAALHRLSGFFLLFLLLLLAYDLADSQLHPALARRLNLSTSIMLSLPFGVPLRQWVTRVFYAALSLLAFTGILYYLAKAEVWHLLPHQFPLLIAHEAAGWGFLCVALVKAYLDLTQISVQLLRYLREH